MSGPPASRSRFGEVVVAIALAVATVAALAPWPRPRVDLDACELVPIGRFGFQCDLVTLAERTGRRWIRQDVRVYEDGMRLNPAATAGEAFRLQTGGVHTNGRVLTFSALDGSDPRANGRVYELASPVPIAPWTRSAGGRAAAGALLAGIFGVLWLRLRGRSRSFLFSAGIAVGIACVLVQMVAVLKASPVHVDAGYILGAAESVSSGGVPYRTLLYHYTPLGLYEFSAWGRLWAGSAAPYAWYLALVLLNEAGCAGMLFLFLRRSGCAGDVAGLTAACFLSLTLWFDGGRILHEPLYLLPTLAAAWLALSPRVAVPGILAGVLAAVAFMVKQYGGFALWGLLGSALTARNDRPKRAAAVALGFVVGLLTVLLGLVAAKVDLTGLLREALGGNYPRKYEAVWLKLFVQACPIAMLAVATPFLTNGWTRPGVRVAVSFGLASLMPLYFRQHQYYFLILAPWIYILFALGVDSLARHWPRREALVHGLAAALLLSTPVRAVAAQANMLLSDLRSDQLRRGKLMTNAWPSDRPTLILGHPGLYHITRYRSPNEAGLGYRFAHEWTAAQLRQGLSLAAGVWIDPRTMYGRGADGVLKRAGSSLAQELSLNGFEQRLVIEDRLELWTRTPSPR